MRAGTHGVLRGRWRVHGKRHSRLPQCRRALRPALPLSARDHGIPQLFRRPSPRVLRLLLRPHAGPERRAQRRPSQASRAGAEGNAFSCRDPEHRRTAPEGRQPKRAGAARQRVAQLLHGLRRLVHCRGAADPARTESRRRAALRALRRHREAGRGAVRGAVGRRHRDSGRARHSQRRPARDRRHKSGGVPSRRSYRLLQRRSLGHHQPHPHPARRHADLCIATNVGEVLGY